MNIKNIVLASLLALASLQLNATTLSDLGYTGPMIAANVYGWAKFDPAKAYAALHSGLNFNDAQERILTAAAKGYVPGSTPVTPPVETGPTQAEKDAAAEAAAQKESDLKAAITAADTAKKQAAHHASEALRHKNDAVRLAGESKKAEAQAAATSAQNEAGKAKTEADKANTAATSSATSSGYNVVAMNDATAANTSATNAQTYATAAQTAVDNIPAPVQPPVDTNPGSGNTTPTGTQHAEAIRLIDEIADKVNKTPYAGNLRTKLNNTAPVSGAAHRSKTLGRLGKDKVNKTYKKARVKTAYKDA